jgi:type II secretory pathway pseudopilin PulG
VSKTALDGERGFTLLETIVATSVTTGVAVGVLSVVLSSLHSVNRIEERVNLSDHALNMLSDVREATAYEPALLKQLVGRSAAGSFSTADPDAPQTFRATFSLTQASPVAPIVGVATVTDAAGNAVTEQQTFSAEAPAPGSVIDAATAAPTDGR